MFGFVMVLVRGERGGWRVMSIGRGVGVRDRVGVVVGVGSKVEAKVEGHTIVNK